MAKSIKEVEFELNRVYKTYSDQIIVTNDVAQLLHQNVDIKASGNQIESGLRNLLSSLLPNKIQVTHGHIVDKTFAISRQQDIIIVEGLDSKSLIKTLDGTEFIVFESIFCIGEVKKTWSLDTLKLTTESIQDIKDRLTRNSIAPNVFSTIPDVITVPDKLTDNPFRNPLLTFAFSIDFSKNAKYDSFKEYLTDRKNWKYLPNLVVVLNQGIFVLIDEEKSSKTSISIKLYPEFEVDNERCKWYFVPNEVNTGKNLAFLVFAIQQHVNDSLLERPPLLEYGAGLLDIDISTLTEI